MLRAVYLLSGRLSWSLFVGSEDLTVCDSDGDALGRVVTRKLFNFQRFVMSLVETRLCGRIGVQDDGKRTHPWDSHACHTLGMDMLDLD